MAAVLSEFSYKILAFSNFSGLVLGVTAEATHKARKVETEAKIKQAIEQLRATNQKVTRVAVAKMTGLERARISQNYGHLFD